MIALQPAGAIPYESNLPTVDILGLNDRWIAMHGVRINMRPGHLVQAPLSYLVDRRVNLLIEDPMFVPSGARRCYGTDDIVLMSNREVWQHLPRGTQVLEIPVGDTYSLVAVVLRGNHRIDEVVAHGQARLVPLC